MERAVVEALYRAADEPHGEPLRQALPLEPACWDKLERNEQQRIVAALVERVAYDRRLQQGRIQLRHVAGTEIVIRAGKPPLVRQTPPEHLEKAEAVPPLQGPIPRITKLLALAVRFEELLRNGTAKDYADLARLGGVSRSRITQVMQLRELAPVLQERILDIEPRLGTVINERALRGIGALVDWREQIKKFDQICGRRGAAQ
jgi:hypothetical protein